MKLIDEIHRSYVFNRRVRVLSGVLAEAIPEGSSVLDVGCGDGLLSHLIRQSRPDLEITGIDVMERQHSYAPVALFDGSHLPYPDSSFDVVMFVDVLHHTDDPLVLLLEASRVARRAIVIKDHLLNGVLAGPTLRFMDRVGNSRHGVRLPYNYWPRGSWHEAIRRIGWRVGDWDEDLGLYPGPSDWVFGRSLHFVTRLEPQG